VVTIHGNRIKMQPDNPVERVNSVEDKNHPCYRYSVFAFIEKLNELSKSSDPILKQLIPDNRKRDYYRLPTEAEWEYVVRDRGRASGTWPFGGNGANPEKYAWYSANSSNITHPVAEKLPLTIDGYQFFDLYGNVQEWVQDWDSPSQGGIDPKGSNKGSCRVVCGGHYLCSAQNLQFMFRSSWRAHDRHPFLGFRLVRIPR
jgi:formylglycine-generating enzyme required for sulfatase activity